jgi:hypothetical protein
MELPEILYKKSDFIETTSGKMDFLKKINLL